MATSVDLVGTEAIAKDTGVSFGGRGVNMRSLSISLHQIFLVKLLHVSAYLLDYEEQSRHDLDENENCYELEEESYRVNFCVNKRHAWVDDIFHRILDFWLGDSVLYRAYYIHEHIINIFT